MLREMMLSGMDVCRLNFSHGNYAFYTELIQNIRAVSAELGLHTAILADLQGPKMRVGEMQDGPIELVEGAELIITTEPIKGRQGMVSTSYTQFPQDVKKGELVLLDDGKLRLEVVATDGRTTVTTRVLNGGPLSANKGLNLPNTKISLPCLTEKDKQDLDFALEHDVDWVGLSFVRNARDIIELKGIIQQREKHSRVVAKIEKPEALKDIDEIIRESDALMVARGDLGVEMPPEQVPIIQKQAIGLAMSLGKISITATQMLDSMTFNPRPTRAEASDVANAVFDGTDAVMLSGETASGKYPIEAVTFMDRIVREAEASPFLKHGPQQLGTTEIRPFSHAIAKAAAIAAEELNVNAICCFSTSGRTPRLIKTFRPSKLIVSFTPSRSTYNRAALCWGTHPVLCELRTETDALIAQVEKTMIAEQLCEHGRHVIIVLGVPVGRGTPTNMIKFHTIP
jgi:pyruvate kinase